MLASSGSEDDVGVHGAAPPPFEDFIMNGQSKTDLHVSPDRGHGAGAALLGISGTDQSGTDMDGGNFTEEDEQWRGGGEQYGTVPTDSRPVVFPAISEPVDRHDEAPAQPAGKKQKKSSKKRTNSKDRKKRRSSSKEKRGRSNSKGRKKKKKRKKRKKKKRRKKVKQLTGAEVRLRMDPFALECATRWEQLGDVEPPKENIEYRTCQYAAGPMGITFDWRNGLIVMSVRHAAGGPLLGSRLSEINGEPILGLTFAEAVERMKSFSEKARSLTFQSWSAVSSQQRSGESRPSDRIGRSSSQPSITLPKLVSAKGGDNGIPRARSATAIPKHNLVPESDASASRPTSAQDGAASDVDGRRPIVKMTNAFEREGVQEGEALVVKQDAMKTAVLKAAKKKKRKTKKKPSSMADILAGQLNKRNKRKAVKEKKAAKAAEKKPADPFVGPVQLKLQQHFLDIFQAEHVNILNRTYYYRNRAILGIKKLKYAEIAQNKNTNQWDARIYILKMNDETGEVKPDLQWLGAYTRQELAQKNVNIAKVKRDKGAFEPFPIIPEKPDEEIFKMLVVSNKFRHLDYMERVELVYREILKVLWEPRDISHMHGKRARWKKYGTVGDNVFNGLPEFKLLPGHLPIKFIITAKTPAQWNPSKFQTALSERLGLSHTGLGAAAVDPKTRLVTKDVRKLNPQDAEPGQEKPAPIFPGVKQKRKAGTRMGHFFHGLSEETRQMMEQHRKDLSKKAIRDSLAEADKSGKDKPKKKTGLAGKLEKLAAMYDDKSGQANATQKYKAVQRQNLWAASVLQSLFRVRLVPKAIRSMLRRHRAVTFIARVYKGYCGRLYAIEFRKVRTAATIILQSVWRMVMAKAFVIEYRRIRTEAILKIQPIVRGWFARRFVAWKRENDHIAIRMQKVVRGFLARCKFKRLLARKYHETVVVPAVIVIQALYRGHVGRQIVIGIRHEIWIREVAHPATIVIQRVFRGMLGRVKFNIREERFYASIEVQRVFRGFKKRRFYKALLQDKLEYAKAIIIQAAGRMFLAVRVVARRRKEKYFNEVVVPSAIKMQQVYRTHRAKIHLKILLRRNRAALKIQNFYRGCLAAASMREAFKEMERAYRNKLATALQSAFRAYKARCKFAGVKNAWIARRIAAAEKIQSGWRFYCANKNVYNKRLRRKAEAVWEHVAWCEEETKIIAHDLEDVAFEDKVNHHLKKRAEKNIKLIKFDRETWQSRLPVVEKELEELTEEDIEHGWGEHFELEWDSLSESLPMSQEDLLGRQFQMQEANERIQRLHEERDELELDLDDMGMQEIEQLEKLRMMEIEECERKCEKSWEERERKQRNKWKIKSRREAKVKKLGSKLSGMADKEPLRIDQVQTISHLKRDRARRHQLQKRKQKSLEQALLEKQTVRQNGELNTKIRDAYDEIVTGVNGLLQDFSYDMRRPKDDIRANKSVFCDRCGRVLCTCNSGAAASDSEAQDSDYWSSSEDEW
jgi:hypothetical protein